MSNFEIFLLITGVILAGALVIMAVDNLFTVRRIDKEMDRRRQQRNTRINAKAPEHGFIFAAGQAIALNAEALPEIIQLAPFGKWPTRDKQAVQVFNAGSAEQVKSWFDFWPRRLARLARVNAIKVWVGHPDFAPAEWPERIELGSITELMVDEHGLNARVEWNAEAMAHVAKHKYPSVAWDCDVNGDGTETPAMLWSVGMWHKPNIKSVQSVINAAEESDSEETALAGAEETNPETETESPMLKSILTALVAAGIVKESDDENTVMGAIGSMIQTLSWKRDEVTRQAALATEMRTALNAVADVAELPDEALAEQTLTQLNALATDRAAKAAEITELNARINTLSAARITEVINRAIETGRAAKADEDTLRTQLNAEPETGIETLLARPVQLNCKPLDIGGQKPGVMDFHQRSARFNAEVERRMIDDHLGYDAAFNAVSADSKFKPLMEVQPVDAAC